jgi:hypothetical protein
MMVRPIDENDFDRRFPKGFGRRQTAKTAADDHYPRSLRRLLIRTIDRIEIGIVHQSFLKLLRAEISENLQFTCRPMTQAFVFFIASAQDRFEHELPGSESSSRSFPGARHRL